MPPALHRLRVVMGRKKHAAARFFGNMKYKNLWGQDFELKTHHSSLTTAFGPRVNV
jgi:hypothetical protein